MTVLSPATSDTPNPKKPLYEASTQFQNWRYSTEKLLQIRTSLNSTVVSVIRNAFEIDEPGSSSRISFLTYEEELLLVRLYLTKIPQLCAHFRFPEDVEATAISFLKRFYLKNTVMDWHPKNVMLTALFLATKTTNNPISLESYASRIPKTSPSDVLELEFLIAQSLGFEFAVWHAHRALWGIWLDVQASSTSANDRTPEIYQKAVEYAHASRLTDAEFVYTPPQIALACLSMASPTLASLWQDSKMKNHNISDISNTLEDIKRMITASGHPPDVEAVREVDRRLRICKNPDKIVGSKAYLAKQAAKESKAEMKRKRKAINTARAMGGDPFGEDINGGATIDDDDDDDDDDD